MEEGEGKQPVTSALESLRSMAATLVELVNTRVELAVLELREEGERRKSMLAMAVAAGVFFSLALLLLALLVVAIFWDTHRIGAIVGVTVLYAAIGAAALARMRHTARTAPPPFESTLAELARDARTLRGEREEAKP